MIIDTATSAATVVLAKDVVVAAGCRGGGDNTADTAPTAAAIRKTK